MLQIDCQFRVLHDLLQVGEQVIMLNMEVAQEVVEVQLDEMVGMVVLRYSDVEVEVEVDEVTEHEIQLDEIEELHKRILLVEVEMDEMGRMVLPERRLSDMVAQEEVVVDTTEDEQGIMVEQDEQEELQEEVEEVEAPHKMVVTLVLDEHEQEGK